jgi:Domain of unknown function (DUF1707)
MSSDDDPDLPQRSADDASRTLASDAERDQMVARLGEACAVGRLTLGEFEERVELALGARTHGELEQVAIDLPAPAMVPVRLASPAPTRTKAKWTLTILSGHKRSGRWSLPRRSVYFTLLGGLELDLTDAELSSGDVQITVVALLGGAEIVVPDAVRMDVSGFAMLGGKDVEQFRRPPAGAPKIDFRLFPILGGINVKSRRRPPALGETQDRAIET